MRLFSILLFAVFLPFVTVGDTVNNGDSIISSRLGGDTSDWSIAGENIYYPENEMIQVGAVSWQGNGSEGELFVTFPQTYGGGNTPLIFVQTIGSQHNNIIYSVSPLFAGFIIYWKTSDNTNKTHIDFQWFSVGNGTNLPR